MDTSARHVLSCFPAPLQGRLTCLGNHGGFSGARLWRVDAAGGVYCLKAWPADGPSPTQLAWIHQLLAQAAHLAFLPRVLTAADSGTFVSHQDRLWELLSWQPGRADYHASPSPERLEAACLALARLHQAWCAADANAAACPAVRRRLDAWQHWQNLRQAGWQPNPATLGVAAQAGARLWPLVERWSADVPALLARWRDFKAAPQPCVCDPWHDHILFTGADVTGFIDFGSVKLDHVAVDLARLLGSMIGDDAESWEIGMNAYARVRPLTALERALARDLDRTGTIIAGMNWLRWLEHERRVYDNPDAVLARLEHLMQRLGRL